MHAHTHLCVRQEVFFCAINRDMDQPDGPSPARSTSAPGPSETGGTGEDGGRGLAPNPLLKVPGAAKDALFGGMRQVTGVVASVPQVAARAALRAWPTVERPVRSVVGDLLPGLNVGYAPPITRSSYPTAAGAVNDTPTRLPADFHGNGSPSPPSSPELQDQDEHEGLAPGLEGLQDGATSVRGPSGRLYKGHSFGRWYTYDFPRAQCIWINMFI